MSRRHRPNNIGDCEICLVVPVARESGDETIVAIFGVRRFNGFLEKEQSLGRAALKKIRIVDLEFQRANDRREAALQKPLRFR